MDEVAGTSVVLVNMPWARLDTPSIQCGLLTAALRRGGHDVSTQYLNLELAALIGPQQYDAVAGAGSERVHLFGEWLFGLAAFGPAPEADEARYAEQYPEVFEAAAAAGITLAQVTDWRHRVLPQWLDDLAERSFWEGASLVGFTSTFFQNVASLALARRLKTRRPEMTTVFGGANFDGKMYAEYLRAFPFVDCAVVGEGEVPIVDIADAVRAGNTDLSAIAGVRTLGTVLGTTKEIAARPLTTFASPITPDYDDYFATVSRLGKRDCIGSRPVRLLVEFSRGCWWGERHHCTFCGLNAKSMSYRSHSPSSCVGQIEHLVRRHEVTLVDVVDNILDHSYIDEVFGVLGERDWDLEFFVEIKANVTPVQLETLARGGITKVQPGIESLSSEVLKLMRKGSDLLTNVRLLKWAQYYGVEVAWSILAGFPGESDQAYRDQAAIIPRLSHLPPPLGCDRIWLERFSPNFEDAAIGFGRRRPAASYRFAYPNNVVRHDEIAYFFDYEVAATVSEDVLDAVRSAAREWRSEWIGDHRPKLEHRSGPGWLEIMDTRQQRFRKAILRGWQAKVYLHCATTHRSLRSLHSLADVATVPAEQVDAFIDKLCAEDLALRDNGRVLTLSVPARRRIVSDELRRQHSTRDTPRRRMLTVAGAPATTGPAA
jgi:ribosomal peptide maturation radical SAM protein 1